MIQIDLPCPPSLNESYANVPGKGRVKTKAYRAWREQAGWEILAQGRPAQHAGGYELAIAVDPGATKADLGNLEKAVSDALQETRVIQNDRQCAALFIWWSRDLPEGVECRVWLRPTEWKDPAAMRNAIKRRVGFQREGAA